MNERPSEQEIERARQAIMAAPATESGIVLPPHVLEEREKDAALAASERPLNRAERRWQEKQARRRARRERTLNAEQRAALDKANAAYEAMPPELQKIAPQLLADAVREAGGR